MNNILLIIRDVAGRARERTSSQGNSIHPKHKLKNKAERYLHSDIDMKYALFNLFQAFGQVVQIVCKRSDKMRGQAFVVFKEVGEAAAAKNNLNGYPIFGKPMVPRESNVENTLCSQTQ